MPEQFCIAFVRPRSLLCLVCIPPTAFHSIHPSLFFISTLLPFLSPPYPIALLLPTPMLRPILFVALLCLFVIYWRMPDSSDPRRPTKVAKPAPQPKPSTPLPPSRDTARRTVAVGDLHSDLAQTLAVLRLANVVDKDENWSGGRATLVQTVRNQKKTRADSCIL